MQEPIIKLDKALAHWNREAMLARKAEIDADFSAEAEFIKGLIRRATRRSDLVHGRILNVASGPRDVIDYWQTGERHAIDPLAEEYKQGFADFLDPAVKYVAGVAESLPYEDSFFDVVIIRNGLDHLSDPYRALSEAHRVLKPNGCLYSSLYIYTPVQSLLFHAANAVTKMFVTEPWAFTPGRLKKAFARAGFEMRRPLLEDLSAAPAGVSAASSDSPARRFIKRSILGFGTRLFVCVAVPRHAGGGK